MTKGYLGIDIGSISTKGVIIDENRAIIARSYLWTEGNPTEASKNVVRELERQVEGAGVDIVGAGTTGSARRLVGAMLGASVIKNEITAHAVGTTHLHPDVRTILEIGGQDSKIICVSDGIAVDYAMNTLCAAGTGSFLSSQAHRLGVEVEEFGDIALTSTKPANIAARCTVFAESDLVHKIQVGYAREDIIAGLCRAVATNYLNNVGKGKKIAAYYGCLLLRPGKTMQMDNPENPKILEDFIRAIGATPVLYPMRNECCGGYLTLDEKSVAESRSNKVMTSAKDHGAEMVITACPLCLYNLQKNSGVSDLPVVYFTELLAEALGLK